VSFLVASIFLAQLARPGVFRSGGDARRKELLMRVQTESPKSWSSAMGVVAAGLASVLSVVAPGNTVRASPPVEEDTGERVLCVEPNGFPFKWVANCNCHDDPTRAGAYPGRTEAQCRSACTLRDQWHLDADMGRPYYDFTSGAVAGAAQTVTYGNPSHPKWVLDLPYNTVAFNNPNPNVTPCPRTNDGSLRYYQCNSDWPGGSGYYGALADSLVNGGFADDYAAGLTTTKDCTNGLFQGTGAGTGGCPILMQHTIDVTVAKNGASNDLNDDHVVRGFCQKRILLDARGVQYMQVLNNGQTLPDACSGPAGCTFEGCVLQHKHLVNGVPHYERFDLYIDPGGGGIPNSGDGMKDNPNRVVAGGIPATSLCPGLGGFSCNAGDTSAEGACVATGQSNDGCTGGITEYIFSQCVKNYVPPGYDSKGNRTGSIFDSNIENDCVAFCGQSSSHHQQPVN
jgi:hypothetical protein